MAPLRSFLSTVDNVPSNYTVENFRDELIEYLVNQVEDIFSLLKPHLEKCNRSYKDLVIALYEGKEMRGGIDFYLCAARLFIQHPVLVVKPKSNDVAEGEAGPDYTFDSHFYLQEDRRLPTKDIKICLMFNGVDYVAPFYKERIASVMKEGIPVLKDIKQSYKDITNIIAKMPQGRSINGGLRTIQVHLEAAAAIAETVKFSTGDSDPSVTEQPAPAMDPLLAGTVRKRKRKAAADKGKDTQPAKKPKSAKKADTAAATGMDGGQLVDLSEHVTEMDQDYRTRHPTQEPEPQSSEPIQGGSKETEEEEEDDELLAASDRDPTQCVCGADFDSVDAVEVHYGLEHTLPGGRRSFHCSGAWIYGKGDDQYEERCAFQTKWSGSMWHHYRSRHSSKWYFYCAVHDCKGGKDGNRYGADSKEGVKKHMYEAHGVQSDLKCPKCDYVAGAKYRMRDHIAKCKVDKKIKLVDCTKCPKSFRDKDSLRLHTKQDHPVIPGDKSGFFHCKFCDKYFRTITGRRKHLQNDHDASGALIEKTKKKRAKKAQSATQE